jgi:hypothetical protein
VSYTEGQLQGKLDVGQKRVKHEYPKTSIRYQEPMGVSPFSESIDLFFSGENFRDDFIKFEKAISNPAPGRLYSPTFGVFDSIVAELSSFTSDQKTLGEITATIIFSVTVERPAPIVTESTRFDVGEAAQSTRENLQAVFANTYTAPKTGNNLSTVRSDIRKLADSVAEFTNKAREASIFVARAQNLVANPVALASLLLSSTDPVGYLQELALTYSAVVSDVGTLVDNSLKGFTVLSNLATIGNDLSASMNDIISGIIPKKSIFSKTTPADFDVNFSIALWNSITAERKDRNINRLAFVDIFRVTGLIGMMESASNKNYTTTQEIDNDTKKIEEYYQNIVENNETSPVIAQIKPDLDILRNLTDSVLEQKKQQSYTVITIQVVRPMSAWLLTYELYGEYLQTEEQHTYMSNLITGLNRSQASYRLVGDVQVVEIGD